MNDIEPLMPPLQTDIARLSGVPAEGPLAAALTTRAQAISHAQASAHALFEQGEPARLTRAQRLALAATVADWHADAPLAAHYRARLSAQLSAPLSVEPSPEARWRAALRHADRLTREPVAATPADMAALIDAGWSADAVVTISQIAAYVSFQSRLMAGLRLLAEPLAPPQAGDNAPASPVTAGRWHTQPRTATGQAAPTAFTRDELGWEPWLAPRAAETLSPTERAQLEKAGHLDSDYFMLLARDGPVLHHRTRTDMGIFYSHGGLARAERELAAAVTSKVNGCIYCASVHARKAAQLAHDALALDRLLAVAPGGDLVAGQSPRWQALIRAAAQLAATPSALRPADLHALRALGLAELELLDLIGAVAFFSWANRLMLTLGEPYLLTATA